MKKSIVAPCFLVAGIALSSIAISGEGRDRWMERRQAEREGLGEFAQTEGGSGEPVLLPEGVRLEADVAYGSDPAHRIDVYLPPRPSGAPVIFMVHGGAWMVGDKKSSAVVANKLNRWVPEGIILVSVNYRLSPQADPLAQADDVARALAFAQTHAADWGGDPSRFLLMGHSAGAHLVSLLAADPSIARRQGARPWLGTIALDSAAYDLPRIMERRHYRFYDRVFKDDPEYWREASPYYRLTSAGAPMMLVCSTKRDDSCDQADAFAERIKAHGGGVTVYRIPNSHREINQNLGLPGPYTDAVERFLFTLGVTLR